DQGEHRGGGGQAQGRPESLEELPGVLEERGQVKHCSSVPWRSKGVGPRRCVPGGNVPSRGRTGTADRTADLPRPGRTGPGRGIGPADQAGRPCQAQPSISGTVLTSFSPVPAKCFSRYWPAVPSEYILVMALLTASQVSVSPFFMPTPYFSSVKGSLMTLKEPGCWLANPARMRSSVLTASSAPDFSLLTHSE